MAVCDIFDIRCVVVNELIGSLALTVIVMSIVYFIFASKIRLGFDTTIFLAIPLVLIFSLATIGFSAIYAFGAIVAGILLAITFIRFTKS